MNTLLLITRFEKKGRKKCRTNYRGFLFTGEAWLRFLSVKDVLVSAQVRCSRWWDEDILWNHALKKRKKLLDCVIMDGYCSFSYEQQFCIMQILNSSWLRRWWPAFSSYHTTYSAHALKWFFYLMQSTYHTTNTATTFGAKNTHCTCSTNLTG